MEGTYVLHYSEVALKGKNRPEFVRRLKRNVLRSLPPGSNSKIEARDGRFLLSTASASDQVARALSKVFGLAWFAEVKTVEPSIDKIQSAVLDSSKAASGTFRVSVRRSDKSFSLGSMEMERRLGEAVIRKTGRRVDLKNPGESLHVDLIRGRALVYSDRTRGPGGLPVGSSGRVLHLFSGGIDSPVAAWLMMKRGCVPVYLHFYLAPSPEYSLQGKIGGLVKVLSTYSGRSTLVLLPFADYQLATSNVPEGMEPSLFRRFMRMTAEALAERLGAVALSTGDCLSQAASQTVWNMRAIDSGSRLPVLRPLLSYDKEEVIQLARKIGTYELSIQEYKDCCAIITRHPRTRTKVSDVDRYSEEFDFPRLAESSIGRGTLATYTPSTDALKSSKLSELTATGVAGLGDSAPGESGL